MTLEFSRGYTVESVIGSGHNGEAFNRYRRNSADCACIRVRVTENHQTVLSFSVYPVLGSGLTFQRFQWVRPTD